jgi:hypothetical protein
MIYHNYHVKKFFDKQVWICVSDQYSKFDTLFKKFLQDLNGDGMNDQGEPLRCLLVLDGILNDI